MLNKLKDSDIGYKILVFGQEKENKYFLLLFLSSIVLYIILVSNCVQGKKTTEYELWMHLPGKNFFQELAILCSSKMKLLVFLFFDWKIRQKIRIPKKKARLKKGKGQFRIHEEKLCWWKHWWKIVNCPHRNIDEWRGKIALK